MGCIGNDMHLLEFISSETNCTYWILDKFAINNKLHFCMNEARLYFLCQDHIFELHLITGVLKLLGRIEQDQTFCQFYQKNKIIIYDEQIKHYMRVTISGLKCTNMTHLVKSNMYYPTINYPFLREFLGQCQGFFELRTSLFYINNPLFWGCYNKSRFFVNSTHIVFLKK